MIRWLEEPVCLSRSVLWDMQRAYYEEQGPGAWSGSAVPAHATTNCFIAEAYAAMVLTWAEALDVRDGRPVYVLELGAGVGRLGARVAMAIERQRLSTSPPVVVVISDLSRKNIDFCRAHPAMQPLIAAGAVDFAVLDLERSDRPVLELCGAELPADGPLCVIANYIVDSVRQDAFRFVDGTGHELLVRAGLPKGEGLEAVTLDLLPAPLETDHYGDAILDDLLRVYTEQLEDGEVMVPVGFLRWLRTMLSHRHALFLCADKSARTVGEWEDQPAAVVGHGSISVTANLHAIAHTFEALGGGMWHSDSAETGFTVSAGLLDERAGVRERVGRAFSQWLRGFGPAEFERFGDQLPADGLLSLEFMLTILRMSQYDSGTFAALADSLPDLASYAGDAVRADLVAALDQVWARHYRIDDDENLAFHLGRTYMELELYPLALRRFEDALAEDGPDVAVHYNLGLCLAALDRRAEAEAQLLVAQALDPGDADVGERLRELRRVGEPAEPATLGSLPR